MKKKAESSTHQKKANIIQSFVSASERLCMLLVLQRHKKPARGKIPVILISIILIPLLTTFLHNPGGVDNDADSINPVNQPAAASTPGQGEEPADNSINASRQPTPDSNDPAGTAPDDLFDPDGTDGEDIQAPVDIPGDIGDAPVGTIWVTEPELLEQLNEIAKKYNCVGVTVAAYDPQHGYSTYQYGYADISERRPVTAETRFRVASLTKTVVAMLAVRLSEDGVLSLDDDISEYLSYQVRNPAHPDTPITVRMLLQHTSSLYDDGAFMSGGIIFDAGTTEELLNMPAVWRARSPGQLHEYSDFGYAVLGAVCEGASGKLLDDLAREKIFDPLGIDAAFVPANLHNKTVASQYGSNHTIRQSAAALLEADMTEKNGHHHNYAIGNLTITALDFAKILNVLIHGGYDGRVRILSEESVSVIHNADVLGERGYMQGLAVRFVAGTFMDDDVYYHTGSAYGTLAQYFYSLETGHIAVVITTGSNSERGVYNSIVVCTEMSQLLWK